MSETIMCEFWYDYVKPKYGENSKLCYMNADVETRSGTSNFEIDRSLAKKNKN